MGLFDSILGAAAGSIAREVQSKVLPDLLSQVLGKTDLGSIGGLLQQLAQGGLDKQVGSWLGNGSNLPVSIDQLRNALGDRQLQQVSQASGTPIDDLLKMLTQHLPQTVDRMSPNGALEEDDAGQDDDTPGGGSLADQAGLRDIKGR
jgi:uncharacterized protein YidB (DUF937 family)